MNLKLPKVFIVRHGETAWTLTGQHTGRRTADIQIERPGCRLLDDGSPGGETQGAVSKRADRVIYRLRARGGNVLLFAHREFLRILAVHWIGLPLIAVRRLLLAPASLSVPGYGHDRSEPFIHACNGHVTATAIERQLNRPMGGTRP